MKQFDYMMFDNDRMYFDKKKYTKEEALAIHNEESGFDPATLDEVQEGSVCWFPRRDGYPDGCYSDVTNSSHPKYRNEFPVWII
jgi:hypothetical protein